MPERCSGIALLTGRSKYNFSSGMTLSEAFFVTTLISVSVAAMKIACVIQESLRHDLVEFIELTATNRGISIKFFANRDASVQW